ncbi:hypothetical protein A3D80_02215 [Candidatus Roizmanbacteria bacterium RIFCSPHIGHO2_02_FULL_40_13b]|uniref:Uncharacterized protein n=1 Tax=Candidatus Roizmanbacteria bacterium RIFCSPHIGHO2_01_FULL_39_24 TaxID=1802032 RepID=A0A1F7GJK0_9BACT|nr:MAG: hypothetical protein A2799_00090 [Candidatus Roizmanbacteria bacterium RIFCSPHIGHO2_01_FULL_39_24]OGK26646.1 MAG: hypothetical protein A3D80_02215 [Candidatus Roizmanbacteria bacterium RIFCSPHIGHO2_02_FULL_40_13b]OGK50094.1 MAG: hypothetical protein A3A56_04000 [Candidatus Roizmanbacteria bacterium RIFCSPLOWO2_01_FULL_40_32]OGK55898.1 MAG: hypothetical protein A3H83_02235 [Candidatus Roizmanbacteria bacterium RIFCSPLOWO2_02_FULL_39_8]
MTERGRGTPKVDVEQIYADRPDILDRLRIAEDLYEELQAGKLTQDEVMTRMDSEVFDDPKLADLLETDDPRCNNLSPLAAVRNNLKFGHKFTPATPVAEPAP